MTKEKRTKLEDIDFKFKPTIFDEEGNILKIGTSHGESFEEVGFKMVGSVCPEDGHPNNPIFLLKGTIPEVDYDIVLVRSKMNHPESDYKGNGYAVYIDNNL